VLYRAKAIPSKGPEELGGSRIRTADLNCRRDILYCMTSSRKSFEGGGSSSLSSTAWGPAGHWSGGDEQLLVHHLLYTFVYTVTTIILLLFSTSVIVLSQSMSSAPFPWLSPPSHWEGRSEQMTAWCWVTCRVKSQHHVIIQSPFQLLVLPTNFTPLIQVTSLQNCTVCYELFLSSPIAFPLLCALSKYSSLLCFWVRNGLIKW